MHLAPPSNRFLAIFNVEPVVTLTLYDYILDLPLTFSQAKAPEVSIKGKKIVKSIMKQIGKYYFPTNLTSICLSPSRHNFFVVPH